METENKNQVQNMNFGFFKKSVTTTVLVSMIFSIVVPALLYPLDSALADNKMSPLPAKPAGAAAAGAAPKNLLQEAFSTGKIPAKNPDSVKVYDKTNEQLMRESNTISSSFKKGVEVIADTFNTRDWSWESLKDAVYVASKEALNYLLNTFAYDVATWLASGDKGQQPMFFTDGWGPYLTNVLDEAGGVFLESLGQDWGNFNLCNPTVFNLKVSIGLGIAEMDKPKKPSCAVTQMVNNWDRMISDGKILDNIDLMFDSKNNDFGITLDILGRHAEYKTQAALNATKDREEGQGAKSVTGKIADKIFTPAFLVRDEAQLMLAKGTVADEQVNYGDIFMNAVSNFINTLAGKLLDRIFKEGLAALSGSNDTNKDEDNSDLFDVLRTGEEIGRNLYGLLTDQDDELYTGQSGTTLFAGKQASQERYSGLLRAGVKETGPYDVLTKFVVCQDPKNPGVDECVIDQKFRSAISKKITLRQAIAEGLINGDAPFGYKAATIKEGIPYRTIIILRAHRIVPVGWELAARVANEFVPQETWTLNKLIDNYNVLGSPFKGLVDPNWVLEVPLHYCKAQGFGSRILSDKIVAGTDTNNDGDYNDVSDLAPGRTVSREQYCADFQTCIQKGSDGRCLYYGYCTEEKPIWDLQGKECKSQFNTCLTFQKAGDKVVSYLENTLNYNNCSRENAGCKWYCNEFNTISNIWSCTADSEKVLKTCSQTSRDSQGVVGCITNASCEMKVGDTVCNDLTSGVQLAISQPCSNTTKWWTTDKCTVSATCTIPKGGVYCQVGGCENLENLLLNPSFETASTTFNEPAPAYQWLADTNYFKKVGSALDYVYRGKSSLRFYNAGTDVDVNAISVGSSLKPGDYTFSGFVFNNLNIGQIKIAAIDDTGAEIKSAVLGTENKQKWQQVSFDFNVGGSDPRQIRIKINIDDPNDDQVSGSVWFDNFRISQSCITNPITLTMVGDVEKAESKINFDRDAKTCPSEAAGCTEFISLQPNGGVNLVRNPSFEDWLDGTPLPNGWTYGERWSGSNNEISRFSPGVFGNNALRIKNGVDSHYRDFSTLPIAGMKPNTSYRVSFYVKTEDTTPGENWYAEILSDNTPDVYCAKKTNQNCASTPCDAGDTCINDYNQLQVGGEIKLTITNEWRRIVFDVVTTRSLGYDFKLSLGNALDENSTIIIDGVQIEEVDTRNPIASEFRNYGTTNLFNIKKAPDNLSCRGYTKTRPSPYVLPGVGFDQCVGETLVWRKFCDGGANAGQPCANTPDCPGATCRPDSCNPVNPNECCHEIDAPICSNYSLLCQEDEVGCQLFTPVGQAGAGTKLSAVAQLTDYCPAECVGYEAFYQSATFLERQQSLEYFIPKTARACPASAVGCDEFTNLDEVAKGGEGREYYQYLRLCQKPSEVGANCQSYYAWQGSDEAGYQLKSYLLKAGADNTPQEAIDDIDLLPDAWCADKTVGANGLPECCNGPEDVITNPFCKELIGTDSQLSYRIYLNTVSCSDNCHPYRKTVYAGNTANDQTNCTQTSGNWDTNLNACIYQAIPNEGLRCAAGNAGCREYRGNSAGNVYNAFVDTFENGTTINWSNGVVSSEALSVGGHSIRSYGNSLETNYNELDVVCTKDSATYDPQINRCKTTENDCTVAIGQQYCGVIGSSLIPGRMYLISFWAKTLSNNRNLELRLKTGDSEQLLDAVAVNNDWAYYLIGPITYEQTKDINPSSRLNFSTDGDFYLDNLIIKEVNNFVYAVKGSWRTPVSCDTNPFLPEPIEAPQFMLGCKQYIDIDNSRHNLKSFSNLCREEVVGCQAMIDTYNSNSPFVVKAPFEDKLSSVTVPADKLTYIVNRADVRCNAQYQGCQAFGVPQIAYDNLSKPVVVGYSQTYFINDPDAYGSILCARGENGCEEYQSANGFSYFKDPGTQTCEWRLIPNKNKYGWFRSDMSSETPNCPMITPPVGEPHPDGSKGFVGLCPADQNTCTLFIDPVSDISKNLIFNSDFASDVDSDKTPDGWNKAGGILTQRVPLAHDTLYTFSLTIADKNNLSGLNIRLLNCPDLQSFDNSMVITGAEAKIPMEYISGDTREINNLTNKRAYSARIYSPADMTCQIEISGLDESDPKADILTKVNKIAIRKTGQYYTLANTVDTLSCNGVVNPSNGCVLFNDRSAVNYHLGENDISYLAFDADVSGTDDKGQPINNGLAVNSLGRMPGDSNVVLKVVPDRTCATWLACTGSVSETDDKNADKKYCTDLGLCDQADENGNCTNFVVTKQGDSRQTYYDREQVKNYSGLSRPGLAFESEVASLIGNYSPAEMKQVGGIAFSPSTNFETITAGDFRPYGWNLECPQTTNPPIKNFLRTEWKREYAQVITNPVSAQQEGLSSAAPEGTAFVKLTGPYIISSEKIDVNGNTDYTISAFINTEKLITGQARIIIDQYDLTSPTPIKTLGLSGGELDQLRVGSSQKWTFRIAKFTTESGAASIKIKLLNYNVKTDRYRNPCSNVEERIHEVLGSSYFDDIKVKPSLEISKDASGNSVFVPPTCRVYPESDSLSCDYYSDKGYHFRGWLGYCIEPDPANSAQCLMWWPVELIQGGFISEEPSVAQRPLYYCLGAKESHYRYRQCVFEDGEMCASLRRPPSDKSPRTRNIEWTVPGSWRVQSWQVEALSVASSISGCSESEECGKSFGLFKLIKNPTIPNSYFGSGISADLIYDDDGLLEKIKFEITGPNCLCADMDVVLQVVSSWCQYVAQTITPYGQNKAWWERVSNSSGQLFAVPELGYINLFDYPPFGALVPPYPVDNPRAWDLRSSGDIWFAPLRVEEPQTGNFADPYQARAGLPYSCSQQSAAFDGNCTLPSTARDDSNVNSVTNTTVALAQESLKRIFAKSYETYQFQGDGVCAGSVNDEECACPESSCGVESNVTFKRCKNSGAVCEVGQLNCMDTADIVNSIIVVVVEAIFKTSSPDIVSMIVIIVVKVVLEFLTACQPTPCTDTCGPGEGQCISFPQYLLNFYGLSSDDEGAFDMIWEILFGNLISPIISWAGTASNDEGSVDSLSDIIENAVNNADINEYILEGKSPLGVFGAAFSIVGNQLGDLAGSYCSQTEFKCKEGTGNEGKACCFFSSCKEEQVVTYRCLAGPNKGMICDPVEDNCNGNAKCEVRTPNESYLPMSETQSSNFSWSSPTTLCSGNVRGDYPNDYCAVAPAVTSVKVNNAANAELSLYGGDTASLTFTVKINPQQLPLTSYTIDWGDNKKTSLSGQSLLSRESASKPFSASHTYSYWELKALDSKKTDGTNSDVKCRTRNVQGKCCHDGEDFCRVLPRVQIIDNWNWCNNGNGTSGYYGSACAAKINDNQENPELPTNAWMPYAKELRIYP